MKISFCATLITLPFVLSAVTASPWDKGQVEINGNTACPLRIRNGFDREREQLSYNPRFMPAIVTFDSKNLPCILATIPESCKAGANTINYPKRFFSTKTYIQRLNSSGKWTVSKSHINAIRKHLTLKPEDFLAVMAGERVSNPIEFSKNNKALTLCVVQTNWQQAAAFNNNFQLPHKHPSKLFLLYSNDNLKTWQVLPLNLSPSRTRIEPFHFHADNRKLPVILSLTKGLSLHIPSINTNGKLKLKNIQLVPQTSKPVAILNVMAGVGSPSVTVGNKTFVTYMSSIPLKNDTGSPHYIVSYNHKTGKVSEPVFLGTTGDKIDNHNLPVISVDSKGYLHVIGGAHWHSFKHWTSSKPLTIDGKWHMEYVAGNGDNKWSRNGLTYPGLQIDANDTLHLVCRGRNSEFSKNDKVDPHNKKYNGKLDYALVYLRKKTGKSWEPRKDLCVPHYKKYSNWYHKISIDRIGRKLYTTYYYYTQGKHAKSESLKRWGYKKALAHDPVIIDTKDGGNTWNITTTNDFNY